MKLDRSLIYILSFSCFFLAGCSSSGGGGGETAPSTDINIAGTWAITETSKVGDCPELTPLQEFSLLVEQEGTSSTVTITDIQFNETYTGTLNDHTVTWTGSYEQDAPPGTVTLNPMTATIAADCNSLTGEANWTFVGGGVTCSGTTTFTGDRDPAIGCGTPTTSGTPTGLWEGGFTESGVAQDVAAVIQGDQIRVISFDGALIGTIAVSGTSFTASTSDYVLFGGPTGFTTSLSGTFTAGSVVSGTFTSTDGSSGTFSLAYDTDTDKGSSLGTVAGTWTGSVLTMTIDNAGAFTATADLCSFQGTINIIDASVNIYGVSVGSSSGCDTDVDGTSSGYAATSDTSSTNDTLNLIVHNANFMFIEELFRN